MSKTVDMVILKYTDLPIHYKNWQNPDAYLPMPYDLVDLLLESQKTKTGWWTGNYWMGLRLKKEDKVISWKKTRELYYI